MTRLSKNSAGQWVTPDASVAIIMTRQSGVAADGFVYFEYRADALAPLARIEWQAEWFAILPAASALHILGHNYGRAAPDLLAHKWNALIDEQVAAATAALTEIEPAPAPIAPATIAPPPPPGPATTARALKSPGKPKG